MLKVRIYLAPSDGGKARQIAHANIINTGMGDIEHGDYYAHFYYEKKLVKSSYVIDWPRLERTAWELLAAMLAAPNMAAPNDKSCDTEAFRS